MLTEPEKSHLNISRENVLHLLEAAKYLGVQDLEQQCWAFINSVEVFNEATAFLMYLNAKNSLSVESSREPIMQLMLTRIQKFFLILVSSKNWIELDVKDVCAMLSSNYTRVRCELEIFLSAIRWLLADWKARSPHVLQVMQCVRFGLMSPYHLDEIRQSSEFTAITSVPGVQNCIAAGMDVATVKSSHTLVTHKDLPKMFALTEPSSRHYLKHASDLYENHDAIYQDFLTQLRKIKEGEISLNEKVTMTYEGGMNRLESTEQGLGMKKRSKSMNRMNITKTEGSEFKHGSQSKNIVNKMELKEDRDFARSKTEKTHRELSCRNIEKFNDTNEEYSDSIPSSIEDTFRTGTERVESTVFMERSEAILVFGGVDARTPYSKLKGNGREIYRYNPFVNTWQLVGEMPVARHSHGTVYLNGFVYMAGGVDLDQDENIDVTNTVLSFNPANKQWTCIIPMIYSRKIFSFVICCGKIYAIGGQDNRSILSSVECFDPDLQTWREVSPLKGARMGMAAAEVNGKIWIAGGYTGDKRSPVTDTLECYDPRTNTWSILTPKLRYPRYMATLMSVNNDKVYLIGGASQSDSTSNTKMNSQTDFSTSNKKARMYSVSDVDVLDVTSPMEWRYLTELVLPRHAHTSSILSSQILIIGGVTTVHKKILKSVECLCFDRQAWIKGMSELPCSILGHSSVALPLKSNS
ncbi:hypothetical protein WDU94_014983 [Cyamophila willieti]